MVWLDWPKQGPYAPQGSTTLLPKLSVTSKVSARTLCAWVGSRVRFRSSEDVTLRIYFAGWPWVHAPLSEVSLNLKPRKYRLQTSDSLPKFPTTLWCIRAQGAILMPAALEAGMRIALTGPPRCSGAYYRHYLVDCLISSGFRTPFFLEYPCCVLILALYSLGLHISLSCSISKIVVLFHFEDRCLVPFRRWLGF